MDLNNQSEITAYDAHALEMLLNGKFNLNILEIGSWFGQGSTSILSGFAKQIVCVDTWKGNNIDTHNKILSISDPFIQFEKNTNSLGCKIIPIKCDSLDASFIIKDSFFDFIFVDSCHGYSHVIRELNLYYNKLKPGGTIAGHDCEGRICEYIGCLNKEDFDKDSIKSPSAKFLEIHPGVIKAVSEFFGENVSYFSDDKNMIDYHGVRGHSTIWYHTKPKNSAKRLYFVLKNLVIRQLGT